MLTTHQTAMLFPPGETAAVQEGTRASSQLSAGAETAERDKARLFRSLIAYLTGASRMSGEGDPVREGGAGGRQSGSFLPGTGHSLPPELSRETLETLETTAEALGMDVEQLLRQVMTLVHGHGRADGDPAADREPVATGPGTVLTPTSVRDVQHPLPSQLQSQLQSQSQFQLQSHAQPQLQSQPQLHGQLHAQLHSLQPAAVRGEQPAAEHGMTRTLEQSFQNFLNDTATASGVKSDTRTAATQAAALHAALNQALGERGRQAVSDLTRSQPRVSDARAAESPLPGSAMPTQMPSSGTGVERAISGGSINAPLNQQAWGEEMGQRIRWMVGNNIQSATLKLNPPQLGPVDVRISMQNDQMSIVFTAHHALVREALEDSAPRLRELMNEKGFDSVNVDVSEDSSSRDGRSADADDGDGTSLTDRSEHRGSGRGTDDHDPDGAGGHTRSLGSVMSGRVDFYA